MKLTAEVDGKETMVDLGKPAARPSAPDITEESAVEALDEREIADAKAHGLIKAKAPAEKPAEEVKPSPEAPVAPTPEKNPAGTAKPAAEKPVEARADLLNEEADPAKEAARIKDWNPNEKALYHEKRKAVKRAQRAEAQAADLLRQIEELKKAKPAAEPDPDDVLPADPTDPGAAPAKPKENDGKPAPVDAQKRQQELNKTLTEQEAEFKIVKPDFDEVFSDTQELIAMVEKGDPKLKEYFPSDLELEGLKNLVAKFGLACQYADHPKLTRQAPEIAYELGLLLRSKRKPTAAEPAEPAPADPAIDPKKVGDEPPSSGSVNGGSEGAPKRIIDMTHEEFLELTGDQARNLKAKYPREYESLMRKLNS